MSLTTVKRVILDTPHVWAHGIMSNGVSTFGTPRQPSLIPVWLADHIQAEGGTVNRVREGTAAEVEAQWDAENQAIADAERAEYERLGR